MELEIVNFEQAKALKELGFYSDSSNEHELYVTSNEVTWVQEIEIPYSDGYERIIHHETFPVNVVGEILYDVRKNNGCRSRKFQTVYAPTLELAAKWLSMEYGFLFLISPNNGWVCQVHEYDEPFKNYRFPWDNEKIKNIFEISNKFNSYEEALRAGIDKAIEIYKKSYCRILCRYSF